MVFKRHASRNIFCSIRIERSLGSVDKGKFMGINEKNGAKEELVERVIEVNECLREEVRHVKEVEMMLKTAKKVFLALMILLIVVLHYLYFSSPGRVVVNKNGEIYGLTNKAREALQGKKFWRDQLDEVRQEIQWEEFGILRKAANDRTLEKIGRDTNREMEKYYRRYPQIRSSKAERQAEGMRGQFDHIRWIRFNPVFEEIRLKRFQELDMILPVVQSKAEYSRTP
ncbi:MAG: hypothetical protein XU12_C0010G0088 [Deltaproteobacteria bacterium CSP1-8]|nr:MAG: hypothetical protein XU12_C0010G0088 [Deltaproteobacteria bacterium CSP1-8]